MVEQLKGVSDSDNSADSKQEVGFDRTLESRRKELELLPTDRAVVSDLEKFDNMIESLIHQYLFNPFVQNDNANARKSFSGLVNSVSQFDFKRNALRALYQHSPAAVKAHEGSRQRQQSTSRQSAIT
ncbi:MAG: hypothetical protein ACTSSI_18115 [Candidatus Helarchaeota archaeon]